MARGVTETQFCKAMAQVEAGARVDDVCGRLGISKSSYYRMRRALDYGSSSTSSSYTMADLRRLSGLARRTIALYIAEGLMPGPIGFGRGSRYEEQHVRRLQVLTLLKRAGVSIGEMPRILKKMTPKKEQELVLSAGRLVWGPERIREWIGEQVRRRL